MKQENTKKKILTKALELFSEQGYDAVSVGDIAKAVGIKAPSLYNHFSSKQAIFDALVDDTAAHYAMDTDQLHIHMLDVKQDLSSFTGITEDALWEKVRQLFAYSLHDETISHFRRMMTIEQFRSPELARLYSERYVDHVLSYHIEIFRTLAAQGKLPAEDPETIAMMYIAPILTLLQICDREPKREAECMEKLRAHVKLFFRLMNVNESMERKSV